LFCAYDYEKEYRVLVATRPDNKQLESWQRGIVLEDGYRTRPLKVWIDSLHGKGTWLRVILKEGRARATFLPQVWSKIPDKEDFLDHLCMKMGAPPNRWREGKVTVLKYQVEEIHE